LKDIFADFFSDFSDHIDEISETMIMTYIPDIDASEKEYILTKFENLYAPGSLNFTSLEKAVLIISAIDIEEIKNRLGNIT
jgi:hypothetical protein